MIERYSLREMARLWTLESRFAYMLKVERAAAKAQGEMGIIPKAAARAIASQKITLSLKGIQKREKASRHDVAAFVDEAAQQLGRHGGWLHYGLTSSDVLDTALALQIRDAGLVLESPLKDLKKILKGLVRSHAGSLCCGRTHGQHAEPTTFGFKMLGFLSELSRAEAGFKAALNQCLAGKLSGAVGAYSALPPELERKVCRSLSLQPEPAATQVIPRDRHARLIFCLSLIGAFLERLSVELRHLQRSEVGEVFEMFAKGQRGSSAMPHKKNPISAENLTGVSRLLRSFAAPAMENIPLWHERDISHSSVERVIFPDSFILAHYGLSRMALLLKSLRVDTGRMEENLKSSGGAALSSLALNALVAKGLPRQKAYPLVQKLSQSRFLAARAARPKVRPAANKKQGAESGGGRKAAGKKRKSLSGSLQAAAPPGLPGLQAALAKHPLAAKYLSLGDLKSVFSLEGRRAAIDRHVREALKKL